MSASKLKLKQGPLDVWSVRERLSLACSVLRNGDQNWVSVSRGIKPFGETDRPPEWFSQKNCALQYSDLLEKVETPKRKRGDRGEIETPGNQIIRKLTIERIEELKAMVQEEQQKYKKLKKDAEMVKTGQWDDKLPDVLAAMQAEKAAAAEAKKAGTPKKVVEIPPQPDSSQADKLTRPTKLVISPPSTSEAEDSTQDSMISNDDDSNLTIPGNSLSTQLTEPGEAPSPQLHPLTVPGALTKLQTIPMTPVPTFQAVAPGGSILPPASATLTTPPASLTPRATKTTPPSSPLLSSLLKSKYHSPEILQQMKTEVEQGQAALALAQSLLPSTPVSNPVPPTPEASTNQQQDVKKLASPVKLIVTSTEALSSPSTGAPTLSKLLAVPAMSKSSLGGQTAVTVTQAIPHQIVQAHVTQSTVVSEVPQPVEEVILTSAASTGPTHIITELAPSEHTIVVDMEPEIKEEIVEVKEEVIDSVESLQATTEIETKTDTAPDEGESDQTLIAQDEESATQSVIAEDELQIKEEPLSPCSSVSSRVSEAGVTKSARRRGRQSKGGRRSTRLTRKSEEQREESSLQPSDADSSDDERESDGSLMATKLPASTFSESIPNSPLSQCSDTEDERAYKSWKKSIMLVWRAVATHKYASLFLHPVTNDIAPGYRSIVHRPMDLSMIKKNLESGVIRTTAEFQRDMMLMFTNAIMYNSSDHNVYRLAVNMYNDVLQEIEQYVSTQLMVQSNEAKPLRASRHSDKEEDAKKRRTSADQQDGGKSKKRKP